MFNTYYFYKFNLDKDYPVRDLAKFTLSKEHYNTISDINNTDWSYDKYSNVPPYSVEEQIDEETVVCREYSSRLFILSLYPIIYIKKNKQNSEIEICFKPNLKEIKKYSFYHLGLLILVCVFAQIMGILKGNWPYIFSISIKMLVFCLLYIYGSSYAYLKKYSKRVIEKMMYRLNVPKPYNIELEKRK